MPATRRIIRHAIASLCAVLALGCRGGPASVNRVLVDPAQAETLDKRAPVLKAHLKSGEVLRLSTWAVDAGGRRVSGTGERLDVNRRLVGTGAQSIALDSVALFETNTVRTHGAITALAVVTGVSAAITVACLSNPKACFGSCPTFYVWDGERQTLAAEGFSASIAPVLEATDVDALYAARPTGRAFEVRMTNEALETHVVRRVTLLAAARPPGGRVVATGEGAFWQAGAIVPPRRCAAPEGDCLSAMAALDGAERFGVSDSTDLAARETIELEFDALDGDTLGLVIGSRQTLVSTYVLYQGLAYMGRSAASWLAMLQRGDPRVASQVRGLARVLGGIEVQARDASGAWVTLGETQETGPLATDVRVVPLPGLPRGTTRLRLRLARGYWRIDHVALARLDARVRPLRLEPRTVRRGSTPDAAALAAVRGGAGPLTTLPGDAYTLVYELPADWARHELFLESRGYYLEWMREEWMAEENPARAAMMLLDPAGTLRALAPEFKRREPEMEAAFWSSRYVRP